MSSARFQYVDEDTGAEFQWHGGEYIEIGSSDRPSGEFQALDVINVWDHAKGAPRIARTLDAFEAKCREYIARYREEES